MHHIYLQENIFSCPVYYLSSTMTVFSIILKRFRFYLIFGKLRTTAHLPGSTAPHNLLPKLSLEAGITHFLPHALPAK